MSVWETENDHPHVIIDGVVIDELLEGVIRLLWDAGISTLYCCQGDLDRHGYIMFETAHDLEAFIERMMPLVAPDEEPDSLAHRFFASEPADAPENWWDSAWQWEIAPGTFGQDDAGRDCTVRRPVTAYAVRFPHDDIAAMQAQLAASA
jgi:hypothetical protein